MHQIDSKYQMQNLMNHSAQVLPPPLPLTDLPGRNVNRSFLEEKQQQRESNMAREGSQQLRLLCDSIIFQGSIPIKIVLSVSL